jgi:GPH family glycoside/pentoside/hexuronide:cation symporter
VALPLYVVLPNHYAREFGVPLATLGAVLLAARLFDAFIDPLMGRLERPAVCRSANAVLMFGAVAARGAGAGFALLFFPARAGHPRWLAWARRAGAHLRGLQPLSVAHQSWGAMLGGDEAQRSRIVAWREGLGWWAWCWPRAARRWPGPARMLACLRCAGWLGWLAWRRARPAPRVPAPTGHQPVAALARRPSAACWRVHAQRHCQRGAGHAGAVLRAGPAAGTRQRMEPLFLGSYFLCAALSIPLWLRAVARFGLARSWLAGMVLAVAVFVWAAQLGAGDTAGLPGGVRAVRRGAGHRPGPARRLLAGVIAQARRPRARRRRLLWLVELCHQAQPGAGRRAGAAAAGLFGYAPGTRSEAACRPWPGLLPAALLLKLLAGAALYLLSPSAGPAGHPMKRRRHLLATTPQPPHRAARPPLPAAPASRSDDYASEKPVLDLRQYFNGTLDAHGVFTDRSGKVVRRFTVVMDCRWQGDEGVLDEAFTYSDGTRQRRIWRLTKLADGRYTGRADDVVGRPGARSAATPFTGPTRWPAGGRAVYEVQFDDWMYLIDERVMLNRPR